MKKRDISASFKKMIRTCDFCQKREGTRDFDFVLLSCEQCYNNKNKKVKNILKTMVKNKKGEHKLKMVKKNCKHNNILVDTSGSEWDAFPDPTRCEDCGERTDKFSYLLLTTSYILVLASILLGGIFIILS